jgi:hypothetical protein
MILVMPVSIHTHPPQGCHDCEMQRLMRWAANNGLIDSFTGPYETVNRILRLVENMKRTIDNKESRIDHLTEELRMLGSNGDSDHRIAATCGPVGQLPEEPQ